MLTLCSSQPVHTFLLRHVYAQSITSGASKKAAMFFTFLLSSLLHELVMAIVSGKIRGYLLSFQMAQIPLMMLSQIPIIKQNPTLGNLIFWIGELGFYLRAGLSSADHLAPLDRTGLWLPTTSRALHLLLVPSPSLPRTTTLPLLYPFSSLYSPHAHTSPRPPATAHLFGPT